MTEQPEFWLANGKIFEHFRFEGFSWWEILLVVLVLTTLCVYFFMVVLIDRRHRSSLRRRKVQKQLELWLEDWALEGPQLGLLRTLAEKKGPLALHRLLSDAGRFERAVHEGLARGLGLEFTDRIRGFLNYRSSDPRTTVISTRQLVVGDHLRFSLWEMSQPIHHYGRVISNKPMALVVQCTDEGWATIRGRADEVALFFLRDNDFEYPFPLRLQLQAAGENQLILEHQGKSVV